MKMGKFPLLAGVLSLLLSAAPLAASAETSLVFGGGPVGGTFQFFANAMALFIQDNVPGLSVMAESSGGSLENLKRLNDAGEQFGVVYMGDAFLGRKGELPGDDYKYENVRAVGFLFGAPAQLVVRADSGIESAAELAGRRVAVGNAGSGAAAACERFFTRLGIWKKIDKQYLGYAAAASALVEGSVDAFWLQTGCPNASVVEASSRCEISLINVGAEAGASAFYLKYPFYVPMEIPAGTYKGQDDPVMTFMDSAYWCAGRDVPDDAVYRSAAAVYSKKGLVAMRAAHKAAAEMSVAGGLSGAAVPVHPGAAKFWKEQGLDVSSARE